MAELYRNEFMTVTVDDAVPPLVALTWSREEPNDAHAVETARAASQSIDGWMAEHPGRRVRVLVDLIVVKRNFPRATAQYTGWLLKHRSSIQGGAFATKSLLLRAGVSAALLVPGLTMKGFSDLGDAQRFLASLTG